ncbi:MAG TPA: Nramp family divalent metal transporter [Gaiellaceae bacterium]|nr:Nramp family divalent metal transporter [Gaiellaceae bacterium]
MSDADRDELREPVRAPYGAGHDRTGPEHPIDDVLPGEARVLDAAHESLVGRRRGFRGVWPFLGPAFIAAVAYIDPGNFATNMAAGAEFGYLLLWVVVAANLMAMLVQSMSAKLGVATRRNLPELCRERFPRSVSLVLWVQAEVIAMATDVAEFVGAAIGLNLLFGLPLFPAAVLTGVASFVILGLQSRGFRRLEAVIAALIGVIVAAFAFQVVIAEPSPSAVAGGLVPGFEGTESVLLAVGILGATVMPHVIYLHSALTQHRVVGVTEEEKRRIFHFELVDVVIAMSIAGLINMSMLTIAASVFHAHGLVTVGDDLTEVYDALGTYLGEHADVLFGVTLLASGLSSSSVGTMAGQVVMQGFIGRRIPLFLRRAVTMLPALVIVAVGVDPSRALVLSQVVLSFGIPFALIPLVVFCRDRRLMGSLVNRRGTTFAAVVVAALIIALNAFLLAGTLGVVDV